MRRRAAAMAGLLVMGLALAGPVAAQEGDGSPPLVVIPVPEPSDPTTIPGVEPTQPAPTVEPVPFPTETGLSPDLSEQAEGGLVTGLQGPYLQPWLLMVVAVVLFGGVTGLALRKQLSPVATVVWPASASGPLGFPGAGERWAISGAGSATPTGPEPRYELVGFVFDNGEEGEFGLSVLTQGRYARLDEAVEAARAERDGDASQSHGRRVWWVVASIGDGATISVMRPANGIGNGARVSRLERLIDDLVDSHPED